MDKMDEIKLHTPGKLSIQILIILVFIIITQTIHGLYAVFDMSPPSAFLALSYLGLFWIVGDWFKKDCKKSNIAWAFDMGLFLYIAWPVLVPIYLLKTRKIKKTIAIVLGFIGFYLGIFYLSYYIFYMAFLV